MEPPGCTGTRIGEALAVRWEDLDSSEQPPTLTISGTIVYVKGKGFYRQPWTKSDAGYRTIVLPKFVVAILEWRRAQAKPNDLDAVFVSRNGTWLSPHNVRRQWRAAREDTGLDWVTPHTFRKTVATLIDREADTKTAAAQLGHKNEEITTTYYIQKAQVAPDVSSVLDTLGPTAESA
jgi:integrase